MPSPLLRECGSVVMEGFYGTRTAVGRETKSLGAEVTTKSTAPALGLSPSHDSQLADGVTFDDAIHTTCEQEARREVQRRRSSYPAPFGATQSASSDGDSRRLSMMEFGTSRDSPQPFQLSRSPLQPEFPDSNPGPGQSPNAFDPPRNVAPLQSISADLMSNMMPDSFANMRVNNPLVSEHHGLGLIEQSRITPFSRNHIAPPDCDFGLRAGANGLPLMEMDPESGLVGGAEAVNSQTQRFTEPTSIDTVASSQSSTSKGDQSLVIRGNAFVDRNSGNSVASRRPSHSRTPYLNSQVEPNYQNLPQETAVPTNTADPHPLGTKEKAPYSKSGFDMLRALWYVATRKNPEIHIGAVDMSCAFIVCDVTMNDCPIVYVSDSFQNLTGYSRHEIMGQNCRFLQAPDGKVEAGVKREFVDDATVYTLKQKISARREVQQSLINYRKGGKPFLNLLTMIPIPWDSEEIRYFVGFQIDLVEYPEAISSTPGRGGVQVDYKHSDIGQYIWEPPQSNHWVSDHGQTLGTDDVSTLLQQYISKGGLSSDWHRQSWHKMLLENVDDVIHVISLKGVFQYVSPSSKRVLEYDGTELIGSSLSSVCHPSDIVPVTRELKDATPDTPVNLVFRIRRKRSGYMWFESHGSLFSEQGKGRKCIILVGRRRPVYSLSRSTVHRYGNGVGDNEIWAKISTSGMFLFVSSNTRALLDIQPAALVGTSMHDLMRKESRPEFGRTIEKARRGKIVSCKHEVHNRRGQVLRAQTFLYPENTGEGKPSFLLAQTKLIKASSRSSASAGDLERAASRELSSPSRPGVQCSTEPTGLNDSRPLPSCIPAVDEIMFSELGTTKCSSWQFELRQLEKVNRILAEELSMLLTNKKKRKRRKGVGNVARDCANCHTRNTPEWRRGPSGQRDLCNSCGLRWAKQVRDRPTEPGRSEFGAAPSVAIRSWLRIVSTDRWAEFLREIRPGPEVQGMRILKAGFPTRVSARHPCCKRSLVILQRTLIMTRARE